MKLTVENLNQKAYDALKEKIINKEFPPGMRLVDSQLAEEYGISRTPLRDAIRKLAEEGLVVSNSKKGYYVFCPSAQDIEEIFELREILDIAAITKLITEILPNDKSTHTKLLASCKYEQGGSSDDTAFVKSDEEFHNMIISFAGNARMLAYYSDLRNQTRAFRRITSHNQGRVQKAQNYHSMIYQGLKNLDLEMTISAIKKHVFFSKQDALRDFISSQEELER